MVVEAVEVVGDAIARSSAARGARRSVVFGDNSRELREPLDEVALLPREVARRVGGRLHTLDVAEDPRDPRVCVLHVVDRVLLGLLAGEVDVDLDRLVVPSRDEVQRAASTPTSSTNSSRKTTLPRRLDIFVCSPPRVRWTSW